MKQQTFQYNGETLAYYTAGHPDNPPILMVHGYMSSHYVWRDTVATLQDEYYCVAIDLIGHGESSVSADSDFSIMAQGERVLALADYLNIERCHLIGHSMGGQIVMCIAAIQAPNRIIKVINVDGVMSAVLTDELDRGVTFRLLRGFRLLPFIVDMSVPIYRRFLPDNPRFARIFYHAWIYDDDTFFGEKFATWHQDRLYTFRPNMRYTWYGALDAIESFDLRPHLARITADVVSIYGAEDEVVPPSDGAVVKDALPDSDLLMIEECGHFPMWEQFPTYIETVHTFLKSS